MTNELLAPLMASTVVAVAGWVATHVLTRRRDRANKRRDQRVQFIIDAYRRLERAANRPTDQAHLYHADIESAVADIQLFGTAGQVGAAREFAAAFARDGAAPLHALLEQLRADLRGELGLGVVHDPLTHLRITYHGAPSAPRLTGAAEPRPPRRGAA